MKRIEEKMLDAIRGGYDWHESNTAVTHLDNNVVRVRLYGNLIAECGPVNGWRCYDMFEKDPDCGAERRNYVGFDTRKSATETYEYLNGLIACAEAIKYGYLRLQ